MTTALCYICSGTLRWQLVATACGLLPLWCSRLFVSPSSSAIYTMALLVQLLAHAQAHLLLQLHCIGKISLPCRALECLQALAHETQLPLAAGARRAPVCMPLTGFDSLQGSRNNLRHWA